MPKNKLNINTRAREPITRSRGIVRGQFPSTKMGRVIAWESQLERRACYLFEFSKVVQAFREQPIQLSIPFQGCIKRYIPDFELILDTGEIWYVEIKPVNKLKNTETLAFYNVVSYQLKELGYQYILITDQELKQPTRERNLVLLRKYLQHSLTTQQIQFIQKEISSGAIKTLGEVVKYFGSINTAYALIAQDIISIDLALPLSTTTIFNIKENEHENCLFTYRTAPNFRPRKFSDYPYNRG